MPIEVHGRDRRRAATLFDALPATHGCVNAGLSGAFGRMYVDDATDPSVVHLDLDFQFLAGDHASPVAERMLRGIAQPAAIQAPEPWRPLLATVHGDALHSYGRTAYRSAAFDRDQLTSFVGALPSAYRLVQISPANIERVTAFERGLTINYTDAADFLARGFGFAVEHATDGGTEVVCGCSAYTLAAGEAEIEIDTAKEHRRRGLALATGAAFILHCLDRGIEPVWDAANEDSARLATRLGFADPVAYESWYTRRPNPTTLSG